MLMDERKKSVLQAIVQDYVETADPVGSRTIARKYNLGVSSATIRNEMADLEEMGYVKQPHTSSGRIPSDKGYRYYVDFLMKKSDVSDPEKQYIYSYLKENIQHMDDLLKKTSDILSQLTNYVALTMGSTVSDSIISQVQLLSLDQQRVLLVIISDMGIVDNKVIRSPLGADSRSLRVISEILTYKLKGCSLDNINKTLLQEIYFELSSYKKMVNAVLDFIEEALKVSEEEKVFVGGALNILNQPEFNDVEKLKGLLELVEEQTILRNILKEAANHQGLTILIGGENKHKDIRRCSLITATYKTDDKVLGTVGILGPTRMFYPKASTIVEFVTNSLMDIIGEFEG